MRHVKGGGVKRIVVLWLVMAKFSPAQLVNDNEKDCIRNAQAPTGLNRAKLDASDVSPTEHFGYNPFRYHA
jgi:hypothetical protein